MSRVYDSRNTAIEVAEAHIDMAIFPLGATEQHSSHLPLCTDCVQGENLARAVAARFERTYVLPIQPVTTSLCHRPIGKGTVTLSQATLTALIRDVVLCLHAQAIPKIVVLICHGGIWVAKPTIRELNLTTPGLRAIHVTPYLLAAPETREILGAKEGEGEIHAGGGETAKMLYHAEELVKGRGPDSIPSVTQEYLDYAFMDEISPAGIWGRPSLASKEKGEAIFKITVEKTAEYIRKTFAKLEEIRTRREMLG